MVDEARLQDELGPSPRVFLVEYTNKTQTYSENIFQVDVQNLEEIRNVLKAARTLGLRVRAVGGGYNPIALCPDRGQIQLRLHDLKRFDGPRLELHEGFDKFGFRTMTVASGVSQEDMMDFFLNHKLYLPGTSKQSSLQAMDLITTPQHASFPGHKCASAYASQIRFVDSGGRLRVISDENPDAMSFMRCNLGLSGLIYDITFRLRPLIHVEVNDAFDDVESVLLDTNALKSTLAEGMATEIYWFPYNSCHFGKDWEPEDDKLTPEVLVGATRRGAMMTSRMLDCRGETTQKVTDAIYSWPEKHPFPSHSFGFSFPLDEDLDIVKDVIKMLCTQLKRFNKQNKYPINLMIQVQFSGGCESFLGPVTGNGGKALHVYLLSILGTEGWDEFTGALAADWMHVTSARPCWDTEWSTVPNMRTFLLKNMKKELTKFKTARKELEIDRHNLFMNNSIQQLLYAES
ncbi:unnamed protein product [Owenia fusiformis]|uniref:FAD-binding PCMH-type domain-containing protein n=1 Tax=Owenia fusiformis TaxID=6347 RepID=A0A8S4MZJ3_OWEFU|nr:unnamed protein product [Owenia fusiformis]